MKFLGIDYGGKRIGLAVSDAAGSIAFPRGTIVNDGDVMETIGSLIASENVESIIMGDGRALGGAENSITADAEAFATALRDTGLPVKLVFEGWSSIEANRYAPDDRHDDSAAAAVILQRYLDIKTGSVD